MRSRWRRAAAACAGLAVVLVTAWALQQLFGAIKLSDVLAAARSQPLRSVATALALTALSFLCLAVYDLVGARIVAPQRVPVRTALLAGAIANAVSNTLGFHAVTGSAVRAYLYRRHGLTHADVARIVSLAWLALALGFAAMFTAAELIRASTEPQPAAALTLGVALCAGLLAFVAWLAGGPRRLSAFGYTQPLPSARLALLQMGIGAVESAAAIGALYVLLPADLAPPFSVFAVGCIAAVAMGVVAHAPGGIGVFEASVTALLGGAGRADLLAALLLYRAIYNLIPFALSAVALALIGSQRGKPLSSTAGNG